MTVPPGFSSLRGQPGSWAKVGIAAINKIARRKTTALMDFMVISFEVKF
jgi:hypothetical protein